MTRKRLVSLFYFNDNIAGKDMFLAPRYLAKALDMDCEIVFPKWKENEHLRGEYRGVKLTPIQSKSQFHSTFWTEKAMLWWLIKNARRIDVLALFWLNPRNLIFARIYKFLNPKGVCYIKGDFNELSLKELSATPNKGLKDRIREMLNRSIDVVSAETRLSVDLIEQGVFGKRLSQRVLHMPNAFDTELLASSGIEKKSFDQKENLIITVGRIGHPDKNNEMVLQALDKIDMRGWQFMFVGPIEPDFAAKYEQFIANNPDKAQSVTLRGAVNDRSELWQIYNRAKVFVLTSPKEGFPNVFTEALQFGNYIITTAVASANDITNDQKYGAVIAVADTVALRGKFNDLFMGKIDVAQFSNLAIYHSKQFEWNRAVMQTAERIKKVYDEKHS